MHRVLEDLMLNLDQTLLSRVCSASHTLHEKGAKSVPFVGKGKTKQITGTFTVTMSGLFSRCIVDSEMPSTRDLVSG